MVKRTRRRFQNGDRVWKVLGQLLEPKRAVVCEKRTLVVSMKIASCHRELLKLLRRECAASHRDRIAVRAVLRVEKKNAILSTSIGQRLLQWWIFLCYWCTPPFPATSNGAPYIPTRRLAVLHRTPFHRGFCHVGAGLVPMRPLLLPASETV